MLTRCRPERALTGRRLEVDLPYSDGITTRVATFVPGLSNRLIPLFERVGRRVPARYPSRTDREDAAAHAR